MPLLPLFKYEKRAKYPGMAPLDREIWDRYIEQNPSAFDFVAYNVAVGRGTEMNTVVNPDTGGDINRLYQRKIDVVGRIPSGYVVVELKPRASTAAIGQVQGYVTLFVRDFDVSVPVTPLIITDELLPDVEFLAKEAKVSIVVA